MKKVFIVSIVILGLSLQGCIVKSIYPFFKESDVIFRPELVGNWTDEEGTPWNIHVNPYKPNSYELHCTKNDRDVALAGNLFTIEGNLYLDLFPVSDNSEEVLVFDLHLVPTHSVAIVESLSSDEVQIKWFDESWLASMFSQNRIRIGHEKILDTADNPKDDDGMYLLTARTDELQKFIVKYRNEAMASVENAVDLKLKRTN